MVAEGHGAADVTATTPVLAAVMPNSEHVERGWQTYQVTLGEVERRSGYPLRLQRPLWQRCERGRWRQRGWPMRP